MALDKKGKQKITILKQAFWLIWLFGIFFFSVQGHAQDTASRADSLKLLHAYSEAANLYADLAGEQQALSHWAQAANSYWEAAECWYYLSLQDMYLSLVQADSMLQLSQSPQDSLTANIANSWGKLYYQGGYPEEALQYYNQALEIRKKVLAPDHPDIMGSLNNLGLFAYYYQDDYQLALQYYHQALAIAEQNPDVPVEWQARLYANLARTFNSLDLIDSMNYALSRSLSLYQAEQTRATHPELIDLQLEICQSRIQLGDFELAEGLLKSYERSITDESLPLATRKKLPQLLQLLGDLYKARQDWPRARESYLRTQTAYERYPPDNPRQTLYLQQRLAELSLLQGKYQESERVYHSILKDSLSLDQASKQSIHLNLAQLYEQLEKTSLIRQELSRVGALEELDQYDQSRYYLMQARLEDGKGAESLYRKAEQSLLKLGDRQVALSRLYWEMANWYQTQQRPEAAVASLSKAMNANLRQGDWQQNHTKDDLLSLPQQILNLTARGQLQEQNEKALADFLAADQLLEVLGYYYPAEESRRILREQLGDFYGKAISLLFADKQSLTDSVKLEWAYRMAEKSRANSLRERQQELELLQAELAPDLQDSLRLAQQLLSHLRNQWFESQDSLDKARLDRRMASAKERCLFWNEQLAAAYPQYHALKYAPVIPDFRDLRKQLLEGEYLLDYFLAEQEVFVLFLSKERQKAYRIPLPEGGLSSLGQLLQSLQSLDAFYANGQQSQEDFASLAHQWFQCLLAPILEEQPAPERLWIIPDGQLGYLPFEILLSQAAGPEDDFRSFPYLLHKYPIRYSYLSQTYRTEPLAAEISYTGFAPIYQMEEGKEGVLRNIPLQNLAWARKEVLAGQEILGGEVFLDQNASEQQLRSLKKWPAVLHFSMHALVDDQNPLHSRLAFSPTEAHSDLQVHEIYLLPLQSQLAVLSACNTALGPLFGGEGIVSLARAFRYAGCPSVLASLWLVDEKASYDIHTTYFQALADGKDKSRSIHEAKLQYLNQAGSKAAAHPFYWASLIQIGDPAPLKIEKSSIGLWGAAGAFLLGLAFYGFRFFRKKLNTHLSNASANPVPKAHHI